MIEGTLLNSLITADHAVFRFINLRLSNPVLDRVMPWLNWNAAFVPALILLAVALIWKGGTRGRICLAALIIVLGLGDGCVINPIKKAVHRPRPFLTLPTVHVLGGKGGSGSFPSSHAANWFAAAMVAGMFYRRSRRVLFPAAAVIGFSRVYNGMHYPLDVLGGAVLGSAYGWGGVRGLDLLWKSAGRRWFPLWWHRLPSLLRPMRKKTSELSPEETERLQCRQWERLGYVLIGLVLLARLFYLASGQIQLSQDEAYQWLWSKHPALSYFSKPPLIAYTQWLGVHLWGDSEFGVRFFSPVLGACLSIWMLRFLARETNGRVGWAVILMATATPLLAVGSVLMTVDPLSVFFWMAALFAGWRAVQRDSTWAWLECGVWMGLGFLSKYMPLFQLLSWGLFFGLWRPARRQLRRPGPYLALALLALSTLPVLVWNDTHHWITVAHLENRAGLDSVWHPTLRFFGEFVGSELGLLNPVFVVFAVWAAIAFWRHERERHDPLLLYFFSMGAPVFGIYLLYTLRARVQPNWIAPSILPLFCLGAVYWERRRRAGVRWIQGWWVAGTTLGLVGVLLLHDTDWIKKLTGHSLPVAYDPLHRVRGWRAMARAVGQARDRLLAEGEPVFIIGGHYGTTGLLSFYLPAAKMGVPDHPLVYYQASSHPRNQFFFWPGYLGRKGQNAIYVRQVDQPGPPPQSILREFASVTDWGMVGVRRKGRVLHWIQIFACRDLR